MQPVAVVLWPFVQGLGPGEFYPFEKMHRLLKEFCEREGIPFLDLLDTFRQYRPQNLWVSPADRHFNPRGHRLAVEPISGFLREHSGFPTIRQ